MLTIELECADTPETAALLSARDVESDALYPPEEQFRIPAGEHSRDDLLFFMLREHGAPIGCGALQLHDEYAEMKSVYLTPGGRGLGLVIVRRLETAACELGYNEVRLETGNRSPSAVKTYERAGYEHCRRFGAYPENESSVFMMKRLMSGDASAAPNRPEPHGHEDWRRATMTETLRDIAIRMVAEGKGILAADESSGTIKKRFDSIGVESTDDIRRDYREMLFSAEDAMRSYVSGVILYDETLRQKSRGGRPLVELINSTGAVPGIKVDNGAKPLPFHAGETVTEGLDGLRERLREYYDLGARFAKWRAVISIGDGRPSWNCINANAHALARYAALCQEANIVPIVEPEVLMDGPDAKHDIDRCYDVTVWTLRTVFHELGIAGIDLEGMVLKPNMVVPGQKSGTRASVEEVAEKTIRALKATVPPAVPGIAFLSGGQSDEEATAHLSAMNAMFDVPWTLTFSYGRALQAAALKAWGGKRENFRAGQAAFAHRARMNGLAASGKWSADLERVAA